MNKTQIEWVKNPDGTQGYTWNPITGCLNHINGMCKGGNFPCYAYGLAHGRVKSMYLVNKNVAPLYEGGENYSWEKRINDPFYPRLWIEKRLSGGKSKGIFVCDMSDLFGIGIPEDWTSRVINEIKIYKQHRFYLLTKQPQNLIKFSPFPDNCWVGVTVCNDKILDVAVDKLEDIQAKVKYISFEPLLNKITLSLDYAMYYSGVTWVIIGAQTKPYRPPKIEWVKEIVEAADKAGIPVFLKDNLEPLLREAKFTGSHNHFWRNGYYTDINHPEVDLNLRQEMPTGGE